jgi:acylphosphatase
MSYEPMQGLHAVVAGRVQGVGFRFFVRDQANACGIVGWVRNLADGHRVELYGEGRGSDLETLLASVQKGPDGALVERVEVEWALAQGNHNTFEIRR